MYTPVKDGIEKTTQSVEYTEAEPPRDLLDLVHCFWELKITAPLASDFQLHAVPDACVDIMFNEIDTSIAGVTALRTTYEVLNLGRNFHYVGIQFLPGVWQGNRDEIADEYIGTSYAGTLPLIETNRKMAGLDFAGKQQIMTELVQNLASKEIVMPNSTTAEILAHLDDIHSVADMAKVASVSPRQLQRTLKQSTGFAPHDLLKVLRLQRSFTARPNLNAYADQAHFIRSFRAITGYTPAKYFSKFDV
ncbi:helix-turn-helix transcriptional regulator [Candidatus Saccharibacteria bacterium]|nr:helix-turn-helix transcriptional regulator [Candidatus Saccharibacteria bacterium]